jgi:hypothetical protein
MVALSVSLSLLETSFLETSFMEKLLEGRDNVEWCASSTSTMSGLGGVAQRSLDGVAQRSLDDGHALMN